MCEVQRVHIISALEAVAHLANDVSRAPAITTKEEKNRVNGHFGVTDDRSSFSGNIGALADDLMRVLLQTAGGHAYSISHLMSDECPMQSSMALSRVSVEAAVNTFWISSCEDPIERARRALWELYPRLKSLTKKGFDPNTVGHWKGELKLLLKSAGINESEPDKDSATRLMLSSDNRWRMFEFLHNYIHSDPNNAMEEWVRFTCVRNTMSNFDVNGALFVTEILLEATESVAKYRVLSENMAYDLRESKSFVNRLLELAPWQVGLPNPQGD